jgi:CHAT domain-containing protein
MTEVPDNAASLLEELAAIPPEQRVTRLRAAGHDAEVLLDLVNAAARLITEDTGKALEATAIVVELADQHGDPVPRASARRERARAMCFAGRFDEALVICQEAIAIAGSEHPVEAGRARLASMHALGELGRLEEAIAAGEEARKLFTATGDSALAARADINIGIARQRQDRPDAALECFTRARPALAGDLIQLGHLDSSRGEALLAISDFAGAEEAFGAALSAFEQGGAALAAAIVEGNLADLAAREGRLQQAMHHFENSRRRLETNQSPTHMARLIAEQAEAKALLGIPIEALGDYEQALRELDGCGLALEAARARCGMGIVLLRLQRPAEAETALAAAVTAFDELGHNTARARVDLVRAELALSNERREEARRLATQALSALHDRPADEVSARHLMARIALAEGRIEEAQADLAAALALADRLEIAPLLTDLFDTRGRMHLRVGRLDAAIDDLSHAIRHIERIRGSLQAERFRTAFLGQRSTTHEALVAALLERNGPAAITDAFNVAEQAKSRSLLEEMHAATEPTAYEETIAEEAAEVRLHHQRAQARAELNALYSVLADERQADRGSESMAAWRRAVRRHEQTLDEIETRLATTRRGRWLYAPPAALETIQRQLDPAAVLIEYFVIEGRTIAFVIDRERAFVRRELAEVGEIAGRLDRLQFQIERALQPGRIAGRRGASLLDDARAELAALYSQLLAPLEPHLENVRRLTIVPHGVLHLVPFHALWDGARHLIERCEVHYAPSANIHHHLQRVKQASSHPTTSLVVAVADAIAPQMIEEARLVAGLLEIEGDRLLTGAQATVSSVSALAPGARLLHLVAHGRFERDNPAAAGLRLADRWLTVRDIAALRLDASLVTLSGCETGMSHVHAGDELMGLLRSFLIAGARSVLASLWRVDDRSTSDFMIRFYRLWNTRAPGGVGPAGLLREAQLSLLAEQPHPAFWAPFILVGRP